MFCAGEGHDYIYDVNVCGAMGLEWLAASSFGASQRWGYVLADMRHAPEWFCVKAQHGKIEEFREMLEITSIAKSVGLNSLNDYGRGW